MAFIHTKYVHCCNIVLGWILALFDFNSPWIHCYMCVTKNIHNTMLQQLRNCNQNTLCGTFSEAPRIFLRRCTEFEATVNLIACLWCYAFWVSFPLNVNQLKFLTVKLTRKLCVTVQLWSRCSDHYFYDTLESFPLSKLTCYQMHFIDVGFHLLFKNVHIVCRYG